MSGCGQLIPEINVIVVNVNAAVLRGVALTDNFDIGPGADQMCGTGHVDLCCHITLATVRCMQSNPKIGGWRNTAVPGGVGTVLRG